MRVKFLFSRETISRYFNIGLLAICVIRDDFIISQAAHATLKLRVDKSCTPYLKYDLV